LTIYSSQPGVSTPHSSVLPASFGADFVVEFVGTTHVLSLEEGGGVERLGDGVGGGVRCCHGADFPAETLELPARHPCTSLSALQAM
jgi:hypothetical protein